MSQITYSSTILRTDRLVSSSIESDVDDTYVILLRFLLSAFVDNDKLGV